MTERCVLVLKWSASPKPHTLAELPHIRGKDHLEVVRRKRAWVKGEAEAMGAGLDPRSRRNQIANDRKYVCPISFKASDFFSLAD